MPKLIFELEVENEWPPVAAESLWLDKTGQGFEIKSIPFFIEGIAYNDVVDMEVLDDNRGRILSVIRSSGNSTVWVYFREGFDEQSILSKLAENELGFEGGALRGYFAINLPVTSSLSDLTSCMKLELENGLAEIAYGVMRHQE